MSPNPDSGLIPEDIVVTAKVVNEANRQRVYRAAALVIKGIARIRDRIDRAVAANRNTFQWGSRVYTLQTFVQDFNNTDWIVTDDKPTDVPGISHATRHEGGRHSVEVHMDGLLGDPNNNDQGGYDEWPDDLGIIMFMSHEFGHIIEPGWAFDRAWDAQPPSVRGPDFFGSELGTNNEKFAWDFAYDAAITMGVDPSTFNAQPRGYEEISTVDQRMRSGG